MPDHFYLTKISCWARAIKHAFQCGLDALDLYTIIAFPNKWCHCCLGNLQNYFINIKV